MTPLSLDPALDLAAATPLRLELLARLDAGRPLTLDGADVARVGQACLQVLASAQASAQAKGLTFTITSPSEALRDMAALARLDSLLSPTA